MDGAPEIGGWEDLKVRLGLRLLFCLPALQRSYNISGSQSSSESGAGAAWAVIAMIEQDRRIEEVVTREEPRLRGFIRRRVPNPADVEELLQDVLYELVRANRLLVPIDYVAGWLLQVARNRITDLFRKHRPENFSDVAGEDDEGEQQSFEDLIPSHDEGPEVALLRTALLREMRAALAELPVEQREAFVAHELEGRSFREMAGESGVPLNTLLARKRYAVLALRKRLQAAHDAFGK
jgi:RNA polymerase sigma factor (sigma-70 family)